MMVESIPKSNLFQLIAGALMALPAGKPGAVQEGQLDQCHWRLRAGEASAPVVFPECPRNRTDFHGKPTPLLPAPKSPGFKCGPNCGKGLAAPKVYTYVFGREELAGQS